MSEPAAPRHLPSLDGLRALAVASVILYHAHAAPGMHPSVIERGYMTAAFGGWVGVDLFFVLSGFLITGILLDTRARPRFFRNFYLRRTLRIFPLYYAVLVVALVVGPHLFSTDDPKVRTILHEQGWLWTYTTNLEVWRHGGKMFTEGWLSLTHLWSLAIEEQFYLVWPLLVWALPRRALAAAAAAIVIAAPLVRVAMLHDGTPPEVVYELTWCRLDTLAVGSLLAVLVRSAPAQVGRVAAALAAVGAVAVAGVFVAGHGLDAEAPAMQTVGFSALALLFGGVVLAATRPGPLARGLAHPLLTRVGGYSYGIYIFHALLLPLYKRVYDVDAIAVELHSRVVAGLGFALFVLMTSTALAAISWHLFEARFLALKDRLAPRAAVAGAAAASGTAAAAADPPPGA